ncbi:MAG: hypothetical protein IKC22_03580 [Bacilli bacterium]|nr:hypothetical protein [Bacilli bacterium]
MKSLLKKMSLVALLLVAVVVAAGCGDKKAKYTVTYYSISNPTQAIGQEQVVEGKEPSGQVSGYFLEGGLFTDAAGTAAFSGVVEGNVSLYGNFVKDSFTYQGSFSLSPATFNPLQYRSTTDAVPLDYTTLGFYGFTYNADQTGFELAPVMAAADPVDVTALYAVDNKYGIEGKTSGYAFRIALNRSATWENGEPITSEDYIYTMKELLDPKMGNYRAANYYNASTNIANAKGYFYSGQKGIGEAEMTYSVFEEAIYDKLIFRWDLEATNKFIKGWICGNGYDAYVKQGAFGPAGEILPLLVNGLGASFSFDDAAVKALDGKTLAEIVADPASKTIVDELFAFWCTEPNEELNFFEAEYSMPEVSFDQVGLIAVDDYTIDIVYDNELAGFYIKYSIGLPLVNQGLYSKLKVQDENGVWSTTYGSSVETYMGYGPYKMTQYIVDQLMVFERNENWFGYQAAFADTYGSFVAEFDGQEHPQYQTSRITLRYVPEIATREQMFLKGELDAFGMTTEYFQKYKSSVRLYNATGASTYYGIILSDYDSLVAREAVLNGVEYTPDYKGADKQYNKTILTVTEFRQALTYAIDRNKVVANLYPGGSPATSLYSNLIIADPDKGLSFNSFNETKEAICEFWGVKYGEGEDFATLDEAYAAITGYDLASAKKLVDVAVDKAIEQGLMGPNTIVRLDYCGSTDSETEKKWYNTFNECFVELFKGTKLEGKFIYDYNTNLGSDFGGAIQSGLADTAWGFGWSGGELDPYDLFQVYVDAAVNDDPYQYDKWINRNTKDYEVTVNLDLGEGAQDYTYTVFEWYQILNGTHDEHNFKYLKVDNAIRAKVLAACELRVLQDYTHVPLMNQGSVQLLSYKCNYGKETYMFGMGFGGLRYITYNYSDAEWAAYVKAQPNGTLSY